MAQAAADPAEWQRQALDIVSYEDLYRRVENGNWCAWEL